MIQSIDTAKSYHDSILTIAAGELALKSNDEFNDDQPSYKFVQTFVLIPTKGVYDVFSDVLTFIPDVDYEYDEKAQDAEASEKKDTAEESTNAPAAQEEKKEAVPEIKESEPVAEKAPVAPVTVPETTADVETPVAEVSEPVPAETKTEAPAAVSEPTPAPAVEEEATPVVSNEEKEQEEVFSPNTNTKESTPDTEEEEKPATVEKTAVKAEKQQEEVKEKKVEEEKKEEEKPVETSAATTTTTNGTATPGEKSVEASPAPESKPATPTAAPTKPAGPPKPFSWASLAASHRGPSSVAKVPSSTQPVVIAPQNGAAAKKTNFVNGRTSPSNGQGDFKKVVRNKNKFNKGQYDDEDSNGVGAGVSDKAKLKFTNNAGQEVYPVYIKHIEAYINETDLKDVLEKSFGKVDSCRIDRSVALVDFTNQEAQAKAIKQHSVKVKGHEIKIEVRLRKEEKVAMFANKKKNKGKKHHSYVENDGFRKVDRK
ncbi:unnamed protein product [Ambrosiozyma monospora]|uniref:Unnamed protein product n=1 Tax=Ambrosiozyma monospora TaxID=43982 RepID=A0ACB5SU75_AMBMO|nr:unnamed protein product [Ambrosiozyma monospora]